VRVRAAVVSYEPDLTTDNAIKWTPPGASVRVVVENGQVSVTDHV